MENRKVLTLWLIEVKIYSHRIYTGWWKFTNQLRNYF